MTARINATRRWEGVMDSSRRPTVGSSDAPIHSTRDSIHPRLGSDVPDIVHSTTPPQDGVPVMETPRMESESYLGTSRHTVRNVERWVPLYHLTSMTWLLSHIHTHAHTHEGEEYKDDTVCPSYRIVSYVGVFVSLIRPLREEFQCQARRARDCGDVGSIKGN